MDFSSSSRALSSLLRRQPKIDNSNILEVTHSLLNSVNQSNNSNNDSSNAADTTSDEYAHDILKLISYGIDDRWEALAVGVQLSIEYLSTVVKLNARNGNVTTIYPEGPRIPETTDYVSVVTADHPSTTNETSSTTSSSSTSTTTKEVNMDHLIHFGQILTDTCISQLEHSEPRVRTLIAKAVGAHGHLVSSIQTASHDDSHRHHRTYPEWNQQRQNLYKHITSSLFELLRSGRTENSIQAASDGSKVALDDTTGWKSLETSLHALAAFLDSPSSTQELNLMDLMNALSYCATKHINRHVRAASLQVLERYIQGFSTHDDAQDLLEVTLQEPLGHILCITLADNWSQVRMAACTLCRTLFQQLLNHDLPVDSYFPKLLPRMCLNRFYLAQGVKLYSQETWKIVLGVNGIQKVAQHIGGIVKYYIQCCDADNHVVREAACQAVAELALKIGSDTQYTTYLEPFVPQMLQALLMCFHDESWPVRDQACLACGTFSKSYPQLTLPELPTLWDRWTSQLTDQIWSVREGAAVALGDAMVAFGPEFQDKVIQYVHELMPGAKDQKAMSQEEYDSRQNNFELHSNSQLYSCGSLAPKLKKGGCSDCVVTRPKALWERTDGCIYMLREICLKIGNGEINVSDEVLYPIMEELADVARVNHFPQAEDLRCTLWKCLPDMGRGLGKKRFKSKYLNLYLYLLIKNLERGSANSEHAASMCVNDLSTFVGAGILKGRVNETVGERGALLLERCARMMTNNPYTMIESNVSPFGPRMNASDVSTPMENRSVWGAEQAF